MLYLYMCIDKKNETTNMFIASIIGTTVPPASYLMSATVNPLNNIAYYYGGETLDVHTLGTSSRAVSYYI
jgi:Mn2+/Fe2+ NRAMP family transporter